MFVTELVPIIYIQPHIKNRQALAKSIVSKEPFNAVHDHQTKNHSLEESILCSRIHDTLCAVWSVLRTYIQAGKARQGVFK